MTKDFIVLWQSISSAPTPGDLRSILLELDRHFERVQKTLIRRKNKRKYNYSPLLEETEEIIETLSKCYDSYKSTSSKENQLLFMSVMQKGDKLWDLLVSLHKRMKTKTISKSFTNGIWNVFKKDFFKTMRN